MISEEDSGARVGLIVFLILFFLALIGAAVAAHFYLRAKKRALLQDDCKKKVAKIKVAPFEGNEQVGYA